MKLWLFGYGSLIWNPGFEFEAQSLATARGWKRRFWQGSHDHRGYPDAPGRVVTLVPDPDDACDGMAFRIDTQLQPQLLEALDYREKNGYERQWLPLEFEGGHQEQALTWIAAAGNFAWAGPSELEPLAALIAERAGPSGRNDEYLFRLAAALRAENIDDPHVYALEAQVRALADAKPHNIADGRRSHG